MTTLKKVTAIMVISVAIAVTPIQAQTADSTNNPPSTVAQSMENAPMNPKDPTSYYWIGACAIVVLGLVAGYMIRSRRNSKNENLTGDINNPASGI